MKKKYLLFNEFNLKNLFFHLNLIKVILNSSLNNLHHLSSKYKTLPSSSSSGFSGTTDLILNLDNFDPIISITANDNSMNRSPPKISTTTTATSRTNNNNNNISRNLNRSHTLGASHSKSLTIAGPNSILQQRSGLLTTDQLIITSPLDLSSKNSSGYSSTSSSNNITTNSSNNSFMHDLFYYNDFINLNNSDSEIIKKASQIQVNKDFKSWLYIYPKGLKYDAQKAFAKARNILLKIEVRDNDDLNEQTYAPIKVKLFNINFFLEFSFSLN